MGFLQTLFGIGSKRKELKELLDQGAAIIDVRTPGEYKGGHVHGSKNIPLHEVGNRISEIKRIKKPLILCCASGMRSGQATRILKNEGVSCINGGSWSSLNSLI